MSMVEGTKKKVLFVATVDYHFKSFHLPYLKWFKEQGWEVHIAANGNLELPFVSKKYNIPIQRSPFHVKNIGAFKELKAIIDENNYSIIHCHTPMGGVLGRLAARQARKSGTKVIYTAHGFHFCKGAPLVNWLLYYPIERLLASYTDCLITINSEDYELAKRHRFKAGSIDHVYGVGVDLEKFQPVDRIRKNVLRRVEDFNTNNIMMFYAAEFNKNKNQQFLLKALALIKEDVPNAMLLLAGEGVLLDECRQLANELGLVDKVEFLGLRDDIEMLLRISDIAVASSLREGLPVNVMEAMACGLPIIATENRGHKELIVTNENGWILQHDDLDGFSTKMKELANNEYVRNRLGKMSRSLMESKYGIDTVLDQKIEIYSRYMQAEGERKWAVQ
ncbi:glycosyltransferase family 4 protein [Bacillus timonensis]|uniref:glycosyltransferase family 4 protein n=1 Tax=Bacillus timonensis TaxID=1033734 RepID=UPI000289A778|nr:glycosyltransferase family 4 protein [Bacillus timonensis]